MSFLRLFDVATFCATTPTELDPLRRTRQFAYRFPLKNNPKFYVDCKMLAIQLLYLVWRVLFTRLINKSSSNTLCVYKRDYSTKGRKLTEREAGKGRERRKMNEEPGDNVLSQKGMLIGRRQSER